MKISDHRFLGLPAAKPRVWIDLSSKASKRAGLAMHSPGRKIFKLALRMLGWVAWLPIEQIIHGPIKRFDELDGHEMIAKIVFEPINYLTMYMGNDSPKTKLTVLVNVGSVNRKNLIIKLGRTESAAAAIRNEVDVLQRLMASPLCAQVPVAKGSVENEGNWTWSIQSALKKGKSSARLRSEHYEFLDELKKLGMSHGDFAPWNCSIVDGKLFVWDWEDAGPWVEGKDEAWFKGQVKKLLGIDA